MISWASRRIGTSALLMAIIMGFFDDSAIARQNSDPWTTSKYSSAWILLGDFSNVQMTERFAGSDSPLITSKVPHAGDVFELTESIELWTAGPNKPEQAPARGAFHTGVRLPRGSRVRVLEVFIDDTMAPARRRVFARVSSDRSPASNLQTAPKVRWFHQSRELPGQIQPDDEIVDVTKLQIIDYLDLSNESPDEQVARLVGTNPVVVLARITEVVPELTENDTWIQTRVRATAIETLRNTIRLPRNFEFVNDDGEMVINGVRVRAGSYPMFKVGMRYIFSFIEYEKKPYLAGMFEVGTDDYVRFVPIFKGRYDSEPPSSPNPFERLQVDQALRLLQRHIK